MQDREVNRTLTRSALSVIRLALHTARTPAETDAIMAHVENTA